MYCGGVAVRLRARAAHAFVFDRRSSAVVSHFLKAKEPAQNSPGGIGVRVVEVQVHAFLKETASLCRSAWSSSSLRMRCAAPRITRWLIEFGTGARLHSFSNFRM